MQPHWTLTLKTGLKVNVPADLDHPVTLTLLELEDWPEPEHAFCRQLAQPGQCLLDADTGYGLYALSFAQALHGQGQGQGRVYALNPDPLFARSVADNGLQALIDIEAETPTRPANRPHRAEQDHNDAGNHGDHHQPATAFDLIRLGVSTPLDPRWLQQADPLFLLPSDSAALAELQAAGLGLYRLIPALNALVALPETADADDHSNASHERHTQADANGNTDADANANADSATEPSAQAALEKPAMLFACNATRAAWLREQGRLIRPA